MRQVCKFMTDYYFSVMNYLYIKYIKDFFFLFYFVEIIVRFGKFFFSEFVIEPLIIYQIFFVFKWQHVVKRCVSINSKNGIPNISCSVEYRF